MDSRIDTRFLALLFTSSTAVGAAVWFATPHFAAPPVPQGPAFPGANAPRAAPPATAPRITAAPSAKPRAEARKAETRRPRPSSAPSVSPIVPARTRAAPAEPQSAVYYSGCNQARAAGAAPLYRGQPGYRPEMDGDGDGIACEPHRR